MEFKIQREELLKYGQLVLGAVERRQTLPILGNILISAHDKQILLIATDLEIELMARIPIEEIKDPGEVTVTARKLIDICKNLPNESMISLATKKDRLILKSGKSRFSLTTLPVSEFPNIEEVQKKISFKMPQNQFKRLLEKTHFSMAQQDVRYYLNGLLIDINQSVIKLIATDGHRLSLSEFDQLPGKIDQNQIIIPRKGVMELMRLLDDSEEEAEFIIGNNHISVKTPLFTFISKLVEGKFPDYRKVIPKSGKRVVLVDRDLFKQALVRVSILSNEKFKGVRLEIAENNLKIVANNPEQEEAEDQLLVNYTGADLEIGFNVNYLLDVCNTITADEMKMTFSDTNSSVLIEASDDHSHYTYVIMPMRI